MEHFFNFGTKINQVFHSTKCFWNFFQKFFLGARLTVATLLTWLYGRNHNGPKPFVGRDGFEPPFSVRSARCFYLKNFLTGTAVLSIVISAAILNFRWLYFFSFIIPYISTKTQKAVPKGFEPSCLYCVTGRRPLRADPETNLSPSEITMSRFFSSFLLKTRDGLTRTKKIATYIGARVATRWSNEVSVRRNLSVELLSDSPKHSGFSYHGGID